MVGGSRAQRRRWSSTRAGTTTLRTRAMGTMLEVTFFLLPFLFVAMVVWIVVVSRHRPDIVAPAAPESPR
jgi:hypothetical protein